MVSTKPKPPTATHVFRAVWPVTDPSIIAQDLIAEAYEDLPAVAQRHGAQIIGEPKCGLFDGRRVPGSGGARHVVLIEAPATAARPREYRNPSGRNIA